MKVTRTSPFSGEKHTLEIDVDPEVWGKNRPGKLVPLGSLDHLSEGERRFLFDGITPEEWEELFEEEAHYLYDREATRAFWICYSVILAAAIAFCYIVFWG